MIFSIFFGFGWFFLFGSILALLTIPPFDRITRNLLGGKENLVVSEKQSIAPIALFISYLFRIIILLVWIGGTIFIFTKANIPLIELFRSLSH